MAIANHGTAIWHATGKSLWFIEMNNIAACGAAIEWCQTSLIPFKSQIGINRVYFLSEEDYLTALLRFEHG